MRWLLFVPLAACSPDELDPAPPHLLSDNVVTFSIFDESTAYVVAPGPTGTANVLFDGAPIPAPADENGQSTLTLPLSTDVAVGARHACVLSVTGTVHCWGDDTAGALGPNRACIPPTQQGAAPDCILGAEMLPTLPPIRALAAGDDVTCAVSMDDHVVCWGVVNRTGGSQVQPFGMPTPVMIDGGALLADRVFVDHGTVCAIATDGALWCWGDGFSAVTPMRQPDGIVDIAFGTHHSCQIDASGLSCSGANRNGESGDIVAARACTGSGPCNLPDTHLDLPATHVVVGERHSCALLEDNTVSCWGDNEVGQLGRDDAFLVGGTGFAIDGVVTLQSGFAHVCALRSDTSLWCWGSTSAGGSK
jgi:alpha-tubulin suppressor-like RCC1 family protein